MVFMEHRESQRCRDFLKRSQAAAGAQPLTVSVISWAGYQESESEYLGARRVEGFVPYGSSNRIRLGCLKSVLPEQPLSDSTGEIMEAAFEAIHPPAAAMTIQNNP